MNIVEYATKQGGGVKIPVPTSYSDTLELVRSDYFRRTGKSVPVWKMMLGIKDHCFLYCALLRLSSYKGIFYPITRIALWIMSQIHGLEISPKTPIGYGFYIGHGIGIIINGSAVIGNNVNISQFTTIGSNHERAATICDNVYIGPSVCIVENVTIGKNSTIGAGSVVVKDVPENKTVAGCPAKVISEKEPGRYVKNRWSV